jgi:DNA-directed RNA polymerase subunit beta
VTFDKGVDVLGTSSILTPFVNSDDGNRVQFSCSQSRQAVSVVGNEPALCQTGYETILTNMLSDSYIKKAPVDGVVVETNENVIIIKGKNGKLYKESLKPQLLNSAQGQDAISPFKTVVKRGQNVKAGKILAEGKHIVNGTISTGTNLLVAIMGWKGYVFEDGYVISDALVNNKLASNHYFEKTIIVKKGDKIRYIATEGKDTLKGEPLIIRTSSEIEELIGLGEDEIEGGEIKTKSPGGKILSVEIYPNISLRSFPVLQEPFVVFKKKYEEQYGEFPAKFTKKVGFEKMIPSGVIIVFKLEDHYPAELGDKLANRHGNKGVITYVEKEENMPMSPWGERIQIIYNPLSVVNRMNPGQLYEMYVSTIAKFAAKQLVAWGSKKTKKAVDYIVKIYRGLDNTKGKKYSSDIAKLFNSMSALKYSNFIKDIEARNYFLPIIVPQFKTPTRKQIQDVMKFVGVKSSYNLALPEYGGKKTLRKASVGYMYFNKLEQQASIKMGARSTAMYQSKTLQPTAGKKRDGGQRAGEADVNMILSHGATHVLKEFLGPLSDDQSTKNEIISEIIQTGSASYREPRTSPTRNLLSVYMTSLGLSE